MIAPSPTFKAYWKGFITPLVIATVLAAAARGWVGAQQEHCREASTRTGAFVSCAKGTQPGVYCTTTPKDFTQFREDLLYLKTRCED